MNTINIKIGVHLLSFLFLASLGSAQQNDDIKFNYDAQFLRNPAALSGLYERVGSVNYLQQYSGISNPPTVMTASFQYPIPKQQLSIGAGFVRESAGLLSNSSFNISTSYKIRSLKTMKDYLSFGLSFKMSSLAVKGSEIELVNNQDPLAIISNENALGFNVGFGVVYSTGRYKEWEVGVPILQIGIASIKTLPQNINFSTISYREVNSYHGMVNLINPFSKTGSRIQTLLEVTYEAINLLNVSLASQYIHEDKFIIGLSGDLNLDLGFNAGYQFRASNIGGFYKLIAYAIVPLGLVDNYVNTGYGLTLTYEFDMGRYR